MAEPVVISQAQAELLFRYLPKHSVARSLDNFEEIEDGSEEDTMVCELTSLGLLRPYDYTHPDSGDIYEVWNTTSDGIASLVLYVHGVSIED